MSAAGDRETRPVIADDGDGAVFSTARLSLRRLDADDAGFMLALMNEPDYHAHIGDRAGGGGGGIGGGEGGGGGGREGEGSGGGGG